MALGDPFDLVGDGDLGVVCVHGFTGTPYEMRYLGEQLARAGMTARGIRLPGHGTRLDDLERTRWADWAAAVEDAFDELRLLHRRVAIVGQSLGGLLALHVAAHRREVAAVASLAAPLWLDGLAGHVARWAARGERRIRVPKIGGSDIRDSRARAENAQVSYHAFPLLALGELVRCMDVVAGELVRVTQPVLVLHAHHDHTAPVACATQIARATRAARLRILPRSYHLIAADVERDIVAAEVIDFLRRHASAPTGDLACAM